MPLLLTGIPQLDEEIKEVFSTGYLFTFMGSPGSGVELIAKQFAATGVDKQDVLYVTTGERENDVRETLKRFGWGTNMHIMSIGEDFYSSTLSKDINISKSREEGLNLNNIIEVTESNLLLEEYFTPNYLTKVIYELSKLTPPMRLVIDSIDFFIEQYEAKNVMPFLRLLRAYALQYEGEILITMTSNMYDKMIENLVENISDAVFVLSKDLIENHFEKKFIIWKIRDHPEKSKIFNYDFKEKGFVFYQGNEVLGSEAKIGNI